MFILVSNDLRVIFPCRNKFKKEVKKKQRFFTCPTPFCLSNIPLLVVHIHATYRFFSLALIIALHLLYLSKLLIWGLPHGSRARGNVRHRHFHVFGRNMLTRSWSEWHWWYFSYHVVPFVSDCNDSFLWCAEASDNRDSCPDGLQWLCAKDQEGTPWHQWWGGRSERSNYFCIIEIFVLLAF